MMPATKDKNAVGYGDFVSGQNFVSLEEKISFVLDFNITHASKDDKVKYNTYRSAIRKAYKRSRASIKNEYVHQLKIKGVDISKPAITDSIFLSVQSVVQGYTAEKQNGTVFSEVTKKAEEYLTKQLKNNNKWLIPHLHALQKCGFSIYVPVTKNNSRCISCLMVGKTGFAFQCPGRNKGKSFCESIQPIPICSDLSKGTSMDVGSSGAPPQVTSVEVASASDEVWPRPKYMIGYCFFKSFDDGKEYEGTIMNFFFNYGVRYEDGSTGELDEFELDFLHPVGSVMTDNERLERQKEGEERFRREDQYGMQPAQLEDFLKRPCYDKSYRFKKHFVGKGFLTGKVESMYYSYYCRFNDGDTATIDETEMETLRRIPDRSYLHFDRDGNFIVYNTSGGDVDLEGFVCDWLEKDIHQMESLHRRKSRILQTNKKYAPPSPMRRHRNSLSRLGDDDDDDDDGVNDALSFVDEEEGIPLAS